VPSVIGSLAGATQPSGWILTPEVTTSLPQHMFGHTFGQQRQVQCQHGRMRQLCHIDIRPVAVSCQTSSPRFNHVGTGIAQESLWLSRACESVSGEGYLDLTYPTVLQPQHDGHEGHEGQQPHDGHLQDGHLQDGHLQDGHLQQDGQDGHP
jgi:hypothetical protein